MMNNCKYDKLICHHNCAEKHWKTSAWELDYICGWSVTTTLKGIILTAYDNYHGFQTKVLACLQLERRKSHVENGENGAKLVTR